MSINAGSQPAHSSPQRFEDFLYQQVLDRPVAVTLNYVGVGQERNGNEAFVEAIGERLGRVCDVGYRPMALTAQGRDDIHIGDIFDPESYPETGTDEQHILVIPETARFLAGGYHPADQYEQAMRPLTDTAVDATIHPFVASDLASYGEGFTAEILSQQLPYDTYTVEWGRNEPMIVATL